MDIGGTKIELAIVNSEGKILSLRRELLHLETGKDKVLESILQYAADMLLDFPKARSIGISSCGPLDPVKGLLLDATNLLTNGQGWGIVPLRDIVKEKFKLPTHLDNDAACCVLAERWLGVGKERHVQNLMVLTLGTGLGTGIICNGQLFRSGRFLHPEAGHTIVSFQDTEHHCGCGVYGDSEVFLSGMNFAKNFNAKCQNTFSAKEIVELARSGDRSAKEAFEQYAKIMAVTLHNYCVIFGPECIVFGGSFAEAFDLFAPKALNQLETLLARRKSLVPELRKSKLENHSCLLGAASLCYI